MRATSKSSKSAESAKTAGSTKAETPDPAVAPPRLVRADAQRNIDALLEAAKAVFMTSGVDAPVREIAVQAGVGVGTVYRHFPQRADLVAAVFRREVDACAAAAPQLAGKHEPVEALAAWLKRYSRFVATKRGLASALHTGDPAFAGLKDYFRGNLGPAIASLVAAAVEAGDIRSDVAPDDLLRAVSTLCMATGDDDAGHAQRMIGLLVDGLRYRARSRSAASSGS